MSKYRYEDEIPTRPGHRVNTDKDFSLGQLMVESIHHRRRIETVENRCDHQESRLARLENAYQDFEIAKASIPVPGKHHRLASLIRKIIVTTVVIITAVLTAIRELGILK
jgi:hypothetical protein